MSDQGPSNHPGSSLRVRPGRMWITAALTTEEDTASAVYDPLATLAFSSMASQHLTDIERGPLLPRQEVDVVPRKDVTPPATSAGGRRRKAAVACACFVLGLVPTGSAYTAVFGAAVPAPKVLTEELSFLSQSWPMIPPRHSWSSHRSRCLTSAMMTSQSGPSRSRMRKPSRVPVWRSLLQR